MVIAIGNDFFTVTYVIEKIKLIMLFTLFLCYSICTWDSYKLKYLSFRLGLMPSE